MFVYNANDPLGTSLSLPDPPPWSIWTSPSSLSVLLQDSSTITDAAVKWGTQEFLTLQTPSLYPDYNEFLSRLGSDPSYQFFVFLHNLLGAKLLAAGIQENVVSVKELETR